MSVQILKGSNKLGGSTLKKIAKVQEKQPDYSRCRSPDKNTFFNGSYRVFYVNMLEDAQGFATIPDSSGKGKW